MDLLKVHRRRTKLSEAVYILLNIALAVALFFVVRASQASWLAIVLVLVSKWRALAVRPRFWFANLVANMVDIIVGISVVILLYSADNQLWLQALITALYAVWLIFIKPRSRRHYVAIQAGVSVFLGITALSIVGYAWDAFFFVAVMWMIGYVSARHILGSYEEPHTTLYSLIVGFLFVVIGWVGFHWMMAYPIMGFGDIQLSQLALFTTLFALVAERSYASYHKFGAIRRSEVLLPILLTIAVVVTTFVFALLPNANTL